MSPALHSHDIAHIEETGYFPHITPYRNTFYVYGGSYAVNFHKIVAKRGLVERGIWTTFLNYLGLGGKSTVVVINVPLVEDKISNTGRAEVSNSSLSKIFLSPDKRSITNLDEIRNYTISLFLSHVGGFYGLLAGVYVLLFGTIGGSPWGLVQNIKVYFRWHSRIKKSDDDMIGDYGISSGFPLADEMDPSTTEKMTVQDVALRLGKLEKILKEYFLNTRYLSGMRERTIKYEGGMRERTIKYEGVSQKVEEV
jgi:hypothetical protein